MPVLHEKTGIDAVCEISDFILRQQVPEFDEAADDFGQTVQ